LKDSNKISIASFDAADSSSINPEMFIEEKEKDLTTIEECFISHHRFSPSS
jgi:uncharacterized protein YfkK (UPF0435 family)